jgi:acetyltransferase-like isoleucine patch superfamily enzyme
MLKSIISVARGWKAITTLFFKGVIISPSTRLIIEQSAVIRLLNKSRIFFNSYILLQNGSHLSSKNNFYLGQGAEVILTHNAKLEIGENVYVGSYSNIRCSGKIKIGNNVRIAQHVSIIDSNYDIFEGKIIGIKSNEIEIEDSVWIGAGAIILPGVKIKKGSIIGAGSVVNKDVNEKCLFAGNPARYIKNI